jgi:hypothetical protein
VRDLITRLRLHERQAVEVYRLADEHAYPVAMNSGDRLVERSVFSAPSGESGAMVRAGR